MVTLQIHSTSAGLTVLAKVSSARSISDIYYFTLICLVVFNKSGCFKARYIFDSAHESPKKRFTLVYS